MLVQLLLLVFCHTILAGRVGKPYYDTNDYEAMGRHFEKFLEEHDKHYDETEKLQRFGYFIANVKKINELNGLYDTMFDINHLTDYSTEELKTLTGLRVNPSSNADGDCKVEGDPTTKDAPDAYDWRDHGAVSPIKDQKMCGSCWAFSTTALVESKCLQQNKKLILSEQQLVDCDKTSSGCGGGLMSLALTYLKQSGGQELDQDYPYTAKNGKCSFDANKVAAKVKNCTDYKLTSEDALKELLYKEGPLAIAVAAMNWGSYKSGIYKDCDDHDLDHGVLLVGYGSENGEDFWVIKNSWGPKFGEKGYIRIKRGVQCCGIGGIGTDTQIPAISTATVA